MKNSNNDGFDSSAGFVYVLSNPSMPNILKIGSTERSVKERVLELSATTGVPTPFQIEYSLLTENPKDLEFAIHAELDEYRVNGNREFFNVPLEVVLDRLASFRAEKLLSEIQQWDNDRISTFASQLG